MEPVESRYHEHLSLIHEKEVISDEDYRHFLKRGLNVLRPSEDFGLHHLGEILPEIVVGASSEYVGKMKVPYQATSYVAARARPQGNAPYIYKIAGKSGGGVLDLSGGIKKLGDSVFASTHRILLGNNAMMVSADNLVINREHIWNWQFFGNSIKESHPEIYEDLVNLRAKLGENSVYHQIVVARSDKTFRRLKLVDLCQKNQIKILDPKNGIRIIFLTNDSGYDYFSKFVPKSGLIDYITTGKEFDMYSAMVNVRRLFDINIILNDGGRIMSNSVRDLGILGEERITLEPYPGNQYIPSDKPIEPGSILGEQGIGVDGGEIQNSIRIHSTRICGEVANVYQYVLNEELCLA